MRLNRRNAAAAAGSGWRTNALSCKPERAGPPADAIIPSCGQPSALRHTSQLVAEVGAAVEYRAAVSGADQ
jgi:hypothetical protein